MVTTLSRIVVEGYRSIARMDLRLGRTNVLVGPNGAGKSNLLSFLHLVPMMRTQSLRNFVAERGGAGTQLHYGPKRTPVMSFEIEATRDDGSMSAYGARLGHSAGDALIFLDEVVKERTSAADWAPWLAISLGAGHSESELEPSSKNPAYHPASVVRGWVARMNYFHFHDTSRQSPLRGFGRQSESDYLRSEGRNLAPYLLSLAASSNEIDRAAFDRILRLVQQIAPFIKTLEPTLVDPRLPAHSAVRLDWTDRRDERFGVDQLSDGTLRAIALITALAQPADRLPSFVCIDEPELGLHPAALKQLVGLVRSVAAKCQVLLATQSLALLDEFEPSEVIVVESLDGASTFTPLPLDKLAEWLDAYSLSDLYVRNIFGGRP